MVDIPDDLKDLLDIEEGEESVPEDVNEKHLLSEKDHRTVTAWLSERTKDVTCPVCASKSWFVGKHLLEGKVYTHGAPRHLPAATYPQAFAVCNSCNYVRTFMAVPMGLDLFKTEAGDNGE